MCAPGHSPPSPVHRPHEHKQRLHNPIPIYASWVETPRRVYLQISRASSTNISASLAFNYAIIEGLGRFVRHPRPLPSLIDIMRAMYVYIYVPFFFEILERISVPSLSSSRLEIGCVNEIYIAGILLSLSSFRSMDSREHRLRNIG